MGIFGSIKKSSAIKSISKKYLSNYLNPSNHSIAAKDIFEFLSNNAPFKDLILNDVTFQKIDVSMIEKLIVEFESFGYGPPHTVSGHCPPISCFFFPDILYFLIIAQTANHNLYQLAYDVDEYFRKGSVVFEPTIDPRT